MNPYCLDYVENLLRLQFNMNKLKCPSTGQVFTVLYILRAPCKYVHGSTSLAHAYSPVAHSKQKNEHYT
jgi:hypothetical protein